MRAVRSLLLSCALALSLAPVAHAGIASGTLIVTSEQIDTTSKDFEKDLKKAAKTTVSRSGDIWHLYFVGYLKKAAGGPEVNLVFYDVSAGHEQVNAFPISTKPSAKILMSDIEQAPEQGFKVGHKYEVRITKLVGGKEDILAKATIELVK